MVIRILKLAALCSLLLSALSLRAASPTTPISQTVDAAEVARLAEEASTGAKASNQGFLEAESRRAARLMEESRTDPKVAEVMEGYQKLVEASEEHKAWAAEQFQRAQQLGIAAIDHAAEELDVPKEAPKRPRVVVFVSQSLGDAVLAEIFERGRGRTDVVYVFRGFKPGQSPMEFYGAMAKYQQQEPDKIVQISLDPPSFTDLGITKVPAVAILDSEEKPVAQVSGLSNFNWLVDRVEAGERGNQGSRGQTYPIAETDLIEDMKVKAASVDWDAEGRKALGRFFQELPTIDLPYAEEQRVRRVEASLEVRSDVVDHEGNVRWRAGQRVDMREHLVEAPVLVIFNSQDAVHVEFARKVAEKAEPARQVLFLTTRVDRDGGFPRYSAQEYQIGRPVYLLMDDVRNTFGIERIPTVVTPTDDFFAVVEVPLTQGADSANADHHASQR